MKKDARPDPKPRKYPRLWQAYLMWNQLMRTRQRSTNRISSIEAGKSNLDAGYEREMMERLDLDALVDHAAEELASLGSATGPIWDWLTGIKGIGAHTAAKLLALFNDPADYATVSKFWRFAGQGLFEYWIDEKGKMVAPKAGYKTRKAEEGDWCEKGVLSEPGRGRECEEGEVIREYVVPVPKPEWRLEWRADVRLPGWNSPFNTRLKSECWMVTEHFIRQCTPGYRDIYDDEKARLRVEHPERIKVNGRWKYNDGHLHNMAKRKTCKIFLQHFWVTWRKFEGLPVTEPYVQAILKHTHIIPPCESGR